MKKKSDIRIRINKLLKQYLLQWQSQDTEKLDKIINHLYDNHTTLAQNPENLESGLSGVAIIFIEAYKKTGNNEYYIIVEKIINQLIEFSEKNETNNYSLYTGRCSVIYVLIQFYKINNNDELINAALKLIQPSFWVFNDSEYVSDSLYDGRAGALITIYELYKISNRSDLLTHLNALCTKIIGNLCQSQFGLYWRANDDLAVTPSSGFARGTSGILYVLNHTKKLFSADLLNYINQGVEDFEQYCWVDQIGNWGTYIKNIDTSDAFEQYINLTDLELQSLLCPTDNLSWLDGTIGIFYSKLCNSRGDTVDDQISSLLKLKLGRSNQINVSLNNSLANGLAGIGCCLLPIYTVSADNYFLQYVNKLAGNLLIILEHSIIDNRLLDGNLGILYFLLQVLTPEYCSESLMRPFEGLVKTYNNVTTGESINMSDFLYIIKKKQYSRTITFLERYSNEKIKSHIGASKALHSNPLFDMDNLRIMISDPHLVNLVYDLHNYEFARLETQMRNNGYNLMTYLRRLQKQIDVKKYLDKTFSEYETKVLIRSNEAKLIVHKWKWSADLENLEQDIQNNLNSETNQVFTLFYKNVNDQVVENNLDMAGIFCWMFFEKENTPEMAIKGFSSYFGALDEYTKRQFIDYSHSSSSTTSLDLLLRRIDSTIKDFLFHGILNSKN